MNEVYSDYLPIFMQLFKGSDRGHGEFYPNGKINEKGKVEGKAITAPAPVREDLWKLHIAGKQGLGIVPICEGDTVNFAVLDIDCYDDAQIQHTWESVDYVAQFLPIQPFISKSGGLHVYVFFEKPVQANYAVARMQRLRSLLGLPESTEIFPKQTKLGDDTIGNWINLPYYGGFEGERVLVKSYNGQQTCWSFDAAMYECWSKRTTLKKFDEAWDTLPFNDAPPCLQTCIIADIQQHRNIFLFNYAVYCLRKKMDDWQQRVLEMNANFDAPLEEREIVKTIFNSLESNKDYKYTCSQEPLCSHCNKKMCGQVIHKAETRANGGSAIDVDKVQEIMGLDFGQLTKYEGRQPYYEWTMNGVPIRFNTTAELINQKVFRQKCVEQLMVFPQAVKDQIWTELVNHALSDIEIKQDEYEWSSVDSEVEGFKRWLLNSASNDDPISAADVGQPSYDENSDEILVDTKTIINQVENFGMNVREFNRFMKTEFNAQKHIVTKYGCKYQMWTIPLSAIVPDKEERQHLRERYRDRSEKDTIEQTAVYAFAQTLFAQKPQVDQRFLQPVGSITDGHN